MDTGFVLKATTRKHTGSKSAAKARKNKQMPAIVYGHKQEPVAISFDSHDFELVLSHGQRVLDVEIDGKNEKLLLKDLQYDHLGKDILHVDLMRVDVTEKVTVSVKIELKGIAVGASEGGILDEHLDHIEIECVVTEIPDTIQVNIKEINVGDSIHARDIELPANVKLVTDPGALILTCHLVAAAVSTEELEEEAPMAPEIITERKEESEEK